MNEQDKALAIALVRAHVMTDLEYMSWVPSYIKVRWGRDAMHCFAERIGGHWRRKAHCKRTVDALACVCKQPVLADPEPYMPPVGRKRNR